MVSERAIPTRAAAPPEPPPVRANKFIEAVGILYVSFRHYCPDLIRYLYLMRFSLILWLSMVVLALADLDPGAASVTRGILTPFSRWQWFFTGLAVVLPGWFALLAARIVCAYGQERFGVVPPPCFEIRDRMEWWVFWGAQLPGVFLLSRITYDSVHEGEGSYPEVILCLLAGSIAALVFWYIVSVLYYWIWDPDSTIPARAFLVPQWSRIPLDEIQNIPCGSSLKLFSSLTNRLCIFGPGYSAQIADAPRGKVHTGPGHIVATIALLCALTMYLLLMPISAPVPVPHLAWTGRAFSLVLAVYLVSQFIWPSYKGLVSRVRPETASPHPDISGALAETARKRSSKRAHILPLLAATIMLGLVALGLWSPHAPRVIPVIAYVVILLVVVFWTMAGIAFFADHFRLPVLTLATAIVLALNHYPAEHVFPARPLSNAFAHEPLPSPAGYVQRLAFSNSSTADEPVIIITATGGGIHAAAWTTTVLRALDQSFRAQGIKLSNHILLMSSVSGGSVATAGFLREYFTDAAFNKASYDRMEASSACSSLQGVAWGLAYPDTVRLLLPFLFNAFPSMDRFDRGWALQMAIDRNSHDEVCIKDPATRDAGGPSLSNLSLNTLARLDPRERLCAQHADACAHFPAFTLNSTVVETGDRFLLSNYSVFAGTGREGTYEILPAASFLGVYGRETILPLPSPRPVPDRGGFADISLLTAARLSATFTYVSPAARLPFEDAQGSFQNAYHFVDGGYYDNDGTNSAIEFLKAASPAFSPRHPLRVLLIEIRNSYDLNVNDSPDSYAYQAGLTWDDKRGWVTPSNERKHRFGPIAQLMAPPEAAKNAGLGSTTARNRRELDTLESALCGSLEVKHVVVDYQGEMRTRPNSAEILEGESELDQPLSWHLTKRQRDWISGPNARDGQTDYALDRKKPVSDRSVISSAVAWFQEEQGKGGTRMNPAVSCRPNLLHPPSTTLPALAESSVAAATTLH